MKTTLVAFTASVVLAAGALAALAPATSAQLADLQPGRNFTASQAFGTSKCENGDFGDIDVDGDLDVATANGGDGSIPQLARIFINSGSGVFTDETATRLAAPFVVGVADQFVPPFVDL